MDHIPLQNGGNGLDPPVGVPGEARKVVDRVVGVEVIQQQERVQVRYLLEAKNPF